MPDKSNQKQSKTGGTNSAKNVTIAMRHNQAIELRIAGATFQQIADTLGYGSPSAASKAISSGLTRMLQEPAEKLREIERERLDRAQAAIWKRVLGGDEKAIDAFIRISKRRGDLLGLDAPKKTEVTGSWDVVVGRQAPLPDDEAGE